MTFELSQEFAVGRIPDAGHLVARARNNAVPSGLKVALVTMPPCSFNSAITAPVAVSHTRAERSMRGGDDPRPVPVPFGGGDRVLVALERQEKCARCCVPDACGADERPGHETGAVAAEFEGSTIDSWPVSVCSFAPVLPFHNVPRPSRATVAMSAPSGLKAALRRPSV